MPKNLNRRMFFGKSIAASAGAVLGLSLEEKALLAAMEEGPAVPELRDSAVGMPTGTIGNLKISRLICGGNLTSGFAHCRDLIYVSELLMRYFTEEKIFETWQMCEENGINTAILKLDDMVIRLINKYWRERGGRLQWIAQVSPRQNDLTTDTRRAVNNGAAGAYIQGDVGDEFVRQGRVDLLARALEFIKEKRIIAGIGGHSINVPVACEQKWRLSPTSI